MTILFDQSGPKMQYETRGYSTLGGSHAYNRSSSRAIKPPPTSKSPGGTMTSSAKILWFLHTNGRQSFHRGRPRQALSHHVLPEQGTSGLVSACNLSAIRPPCQ